MLIKTYLGISFGYTYISNILVIFSSINTICARCFIGDFNRIYLFYQLCHLYLLRIPSTKSVETTKKGKKEKNFFSFKSME